MPSQRKERKDTVSVKLDKQTYECSVADIDMIVDARIEEMAELVNKELKSIGRAAKPPGGGGTKWWRAQMPGIAEYARHALQISARVGHTAEFAGVSEKGC